MKCLFLRLWFFSFFRFRFSTMSTGTAEVFIYLFISWISIELCLNIIYQYDLLFFSSCFRWHFFTWFWQLRHSSPAHLVTPAARSHTAPYHVFNVLFIKASPYDISSPTDSVIGADFQVTLESKTYIPDFRQAEWGFCLQGANTT